MLSILAVERISKKVGVNRIARDALEEARDILTGIGEEQCKKAVALARHAKRKTVLEEDMRFACEQITGK